MSYILSALRKAEQERQQQPGHDAQGFISDSERNQPETEKGKSVSRWALVFLVIFIAISLAYLLGTRATPAVKGINKEQVTVVSDTRVLSEPVSQAQNQAQVVNSAPEKSEPLPEVPQVESETPAVVIESTPKQQRTERALPDINITGYIYFENEPARSKLFVNGIVYRLESRIAEGIILSGFYPNHITVTHFGTEKKLPIP